MNTAHNYHHKHRKPLIGNSEELTSNLFSETSEANANSSQKKKVADQACIEPGSVLLHIPRKGRRCHNIRSLYLLACFPIFSFRNLSKATCLNISILCRQLKPLVPSPGAQTSFSCTFGISLVVDMHFPAKSSWHLQKNTAYVPTHDQICKEGVEFPMNQPILFKSSKINSFAGHVIIMIDLHCSLSGCFPQQCCHAFVTCAVQRIQRSQRIQCIQSATLTSSRSSRAASRSKVPVRRPLPYKSRSKAKGKRNNSSPASLASAASPAPAGGIPPKSPKVFAYCQAISVSAESSLLQIKV